MSAAGDAGSARPDARSLTRRIGFQHSVCSYVIGYLIGHSWIQFSFKALDVIRRLFDRIIFTRVFKMK